MRIQLQIKKKFIKGVLKGATLIDDTLYVVNRKGAMDWLKAINANKNRRYNIQWIKIGEETIINTPEHR